LEYNVEPKTAIAIVNKRLRTGEIENIAENKDRMRDAKFKNLKAMSGRQIWRTCRIICSHFIDYPNEVSSHLSKTADIGDGLTPPCGTISAGLLTYHKTVFPPAEYLVPKNTNVGA
jgi:hypothetical protein